MHAPQIIWIVLWSIELLYFAHKHGQPRTEKFNLFWRLADCATSLGLLWWGGFFR